MTPKQAQFAREALKEFRCVRAPANGTDSPDLQSLLDKAGVVQSTFFLRERLAAGFTRDGMAALVTLAADILEARSPGPPVASARVLALAIAGLSANLWHARPPEMIGDADLEGLGNAIGRWFSKQERLRTHYIPCSISAWPLTSFEVGPVRFYPVADLPLDLFGLTRADVWPRDGDMSGWADVLLGQGVLRLAELRNAWTIAEVSVRGRESARSQLAADLAVDVAIGVIQMLTPPKFFARAARATARSAPVWWATLTRDGDDVRPGVSNDEPGRSMGPGALEMALASQAAVMRSLGRRLEGFLQGGGNTPVLDEAWCNAAFWYHEGAAEPLDTLALAKFETAIEVLFRSESSAGSKRRLVDGMEKLLGLPRGKPLASGMTPEQFAASIVTARSRVLHGTWPTLHTELPASGGVGVADAEMLARVLLIAFSCQLDGFISSGNGEDSLDALLSWNVAAAGQGGG
ncbi:MULTISPECIES: hypothetical protein [Alphaproteobacteria]|uniref:hypothetical protein n=1 Tax=Alphaproteobacteria TaxID=28211 RepID=UPI00262F2923|nr:MULTISPECIES: hypothetical protein [Alphaproteobacteria]